MPRSPTMREAYGPSKILFCLGLATLLLLYTVGRPSFTIRTGDDRWVYEAISQPIMESGTTTVISKIRAIYRANCQD